MRNRVFHSPTSLAEVLSILASPGDEVMVAGGQWIVPLLKSGDADANHIVSLQNVAELRGIKSDGHTVSIGAGETHCSIMRSQFLQSDLSILATIAGQIGDPATRNRGTIGGALASDPRRSDYAGPMLGLNAQLTTTKRTISAAAFFGQNETTQFDPGEVLIAVTFERPDWAVFEKIPHPAANYAEVGLFVCRLGAKTFRIVALGSEDGPIRLGALEHQLNAGTPAEDLEWPAEMADTASFYASRLRALFHRSIQTTRSL
jgi:carbon-monoxide dehydrogenase medium subunit